MNVQKGGNEPSLLEFLLGTEGTTEQMPTGTDPRTQVNGLHPRAGSENNV
ncbi:MAG: hypothetical protein ACYCQJ_15475 [Nitrososphaerales archaeon]